MVEKVLSALVDPGAQAFPLGEQRLVGDLDRGAPGQRLAIEGEKTVLAVASEDLIERRRLDFESP